METCKRCKREIPGVNFVMHVAHCLRNTETCSICGEAVPKSSSAEHFEEHHKQVSCELCGFEVESKAKLEAHRSENCPRSEMPCSFCELQLPRSEMEEHENYCGSRTEKCEDCGKFVLLRDLSGHCCSPKPLRNNEMKTVLFLPCEFCEELVPSLELIAHQELCAAANLIEAENNEVIATTGAQGHNRESPNTEDQVSDSAEAKGCHEEVVSALPCEVCGELCASDRLMAHQDECLLRNDPSPLTPMGHEPEMATPRSHAQGPHDQEGNSIEPLLRHIRMVMGHDFDRFGGHFGRRGYLPMRPSLFLNDDADPINPFWTYMDHSMFTDTRPTPREYFS